MGSVHPLVYVGAGAVVSVVSLALGQEFSLFFYVGIAAVVFGAISAFIGAMQYRNAQKTEEKGKAQVQQQVAQKYPEYSQQRYGHSSVKYCNRCGMQGPLQASFCMRCGSRV